MIRNSKVAPMDVDNKQWLIQTNLSYEENQSLKHIGRWSLSIEKKHLNEFWKKCRKLYKNDELGDVKYLMCSTASDKDQKHGVVLFFYEKSKEEQMIKEHGRKLIEMLNYKPPDGVNAIYYKSKVYPDKKFLYKIEVANDDSSDSD